MFALPKASLLHFASLCPHLSFLPPLPQCVLPAVVSSPVSNTFVFVFDCFCCSGPTDSTSLTTRARTALSFSSRPKSWKRSGWSSSAWPCECTFCASATTRWSHGTTRCSPCYSGPLWLKDDKNESDTKGSRSGDTLILNIAFRQTNLSLRVVEPHRPVLVLDWIQTLQKWLIPKVNNRWRETIIRTSVVEPREIQFTTLFRFPEKSPIHGS